MTPLHIPALPAAGLRRLAKRLEVLGYPVADVETAGGARALLVDRGGSGRAAIVPVALAELLDGELPDALAALHGLAPSRRLTLLAWGVPPELPARRRLRESGVELALFEPLDTAVLRFQMNRALAPSAAPPRAARRAPLDGEIAVRWGLRTRPARVYTLSSRGAFLLTEEPLKPGRRLTLEVPIGMLRPRARAQVVMANHPNALAQPELPPGMAVHFDSLDAPSALVIDRLVEERLAALGV